MSLWLAGVGWGGGGGVSEFCLLHRLGLFLGGLKFWILLFFGVWSFAGVCLGHFQN